MFDPESPTDVSRLRESIRWSEKRSRKYLEQNFEMIKQLVGFNYGENGSSDKVPINMVALGNSIFQQRISPHSLQALVTTTFPELLPGAADLELAQNFQANQINLVTGIRECVQSAMFSFGVMKTGVSTSHDPDDPGEFFADPVLTENFLWDMTAKRLDQVGHMGDRFSVPLEWAKENPNFDRRIRSKLSANMTDGEQNSQGDIHSETLSKGEGPITEEYEDMVDLIDAWLPREGIVLTLADGLDSLPLHTKPWTGPKTGMYDLLGYGDVPGNIMKLGPARLWLDLHDITNRLFNKAARGAERRKTLLGVQGHAAADGQRVVEHDDGDTIYMDHPQGVQEFTTGGADQTTLGMVMWAKQMLAYLGGNWDSIGGLAAQSRTVGQDRLMGESSSEQVKDMQERTYAFTKSIMTKQAWYLWNDPLIQLPLTKPIPGTNLSIPIMFNAQRRMGEFFHYNFSVDPYSLTSQSPADKASAVTQFVTQILLPAMPILQQSGVAVDWERFFKLLAKYMQLPELNQILSYAQGEAQPGRGPVMPPPGMPANTSRTYERVNRSAPTRGSQDEVAMSMMFGNEKQPAEMAGMLRSFG
jgi:hypothetical protein